ADGTQRGSEAGAADVAQPPQPVDDARVGAAGAHDLAETLVDRAVRAIAERAVLDDEYGHRARDNARHRTDAAGFVVRAERDRAGRRERGRGVEIARPAFVDDRAGDRALQRS